MTTSEFEVRLEAVLNKSIAGCKGLLHLERLSGGASQETYRVEIETETGPRTLAMRRAPGGQSVEPTPGHPGLDVEALLMRSAREAGVPEPEVFHVLSEADGLGDGFLMEWLDGIALGAGGALAGTRSDQAASGLHVVRPARIHAVDLAVTGLDQKLDALSPADYVEQTWERYRVFDTQQPMIDYAGRWLIEHLPEDYQTALVHNDFRNGNIMFSPKALWQCWIGRWLISAILCAILAGSAPVPGASAGQTCQ